MQLALETFWFFVLALPPQCCKVFRQCLVIFPNYWTRSKTNPQKNMFFWSNPYKNEVMTTFLVKLPELPTLITWANLKYNLSHLIQFCWWCHGQKLWHHNFYYKIPQFPGGLQYSILLTSSKLKTWLKSIKSKELEKTYQNAILVCIFRHKKITNSWWKNVINKN